MVWVKQVLNLLIVLCIPAGLFFGCAHVNNQISYKYEVQDRSYQEKRLSGNWTENDRRIMGNLVFHRKAARTTFHVFVVLVIVRTGLSLVKRHSVRGPSQVS